jgi:hypothetical protein
VNVFNDYEYDRFQDLDLRFVIGGGLGFHAVKTETSKLDLPVSIAECKFAADSRGRFRMQLPERRIEQRRDATRAPTQGPK